MLFNSAGINYKIPIIAEYIIIILLIIVYLTDYSSRLWVGSSIFYTRLNREQKLDVDDIIEFKLIIRVYTLINNEVIGLRLIVIIFIVLELNIRDLE